MRKTYGYGGKPDAEKKRCFDCLYCQGAVSWWCVNEDAKKYRGTAIPGVHSCQFWEPMILLEDLGLTKRVMEKLDPFAVCVRLEPVKCEE